VSPAVTNIRPSKIVELFQLICYSYPLSALLSKEIFKMAKKKGNVRVITLECTEDKKHRVQTIKNVKNTPDRLELMKYNSTLRHHTLHREIKK
jgi:large subunit ribosomal protein L33